MGPVRELQEKLRGLLWERIEAGALTGVRLAAKTGFRQGYISRFLNRKRGLSLEGMDRILEAEELSLHDLLGPSALDPEYEKVPLVAADDLTQPMLAPFACATLKLRRALLASMRPSVLGLGRWTWDRFALFQPGEDDLEAMYPFLTAGCVLLLDRHYNSLAPYRRGIHTIFAVRTDDGLVIRFADSSAGQLVLRPANPRLRAETIPLPEGKDFHELIAGRVAWLGAQM